jgi:hypothetical protein
MNTSALVLMICTMSVVSYATVVLFMKVLKTPPRPEPDSFDENNNDPR